MLFARYSVLTLCLILLATVALAQSPKREFRGAWIATVTNLDWPNNSQSPDEQKRALIFLLDELQQMNINAVLFQVRSEADAMYASTLEPWSFWLTGQQGRAPSPFYDPLSFAIEETHKRGMELHAWFNPYRVERNRGNYVTDPLHVSNQHPDWILTFNGVNISILDPGKQAVRDYNTNVIMDVVRRYDIDGVHFDDYFYPYPSGSFSGISNEDDATYAAEARGFTNRGDWRRDNINRFIEQVSDSIAAVKPHVKFGISPFGIWKPGVPSGTTGLNAYGVLYADALAWLNDKSVDYLTPQLYWPFGGGQNYGFLAPWWRDRAAENGRHLYPGHAAYRTNYTRSELPNQVRFNRNNGIPGSVFFRTGNLVYNANGIEDSLRNDLYRHPAFPPIMPWKETIPPNDPSNLVAAVGEGRVTLTWEAPGPAFDEDLAVRFALYRFESAPSFPEDFDDPSRIVAVLDGTQSAYVDTPPAGGPSDYHYAVTALDHNWNESGPSLVAVATGVERALPVAGAFTLDHTAPNPFSIYTDVQFTLSEPMDVDLRVYDVLGREVAVLLREAWRPQGTHHVTWNPDTLSGGAYVIVLQARGRRISRVVTRIK